MTNTGRDWAPDLDCTYWLDGVPPWLGGSGDEWVHCCRAHDLSDQSIAAAIELGRCVAETGHILMGLVMAAGVISLGPIYLALRGFIASRSKAE